MTQRNIQLGLVGLVLVLPLLGFGCGQSAVERATEQSIERETGVNANVDLDNGAVRIETEDGSFFAGQQQLPANWPTDVSIVAGANILYSGSSNGQAGQADSGVMFSTDKSPADVMSFYNTELVGNGWTIDTTAEAGGMSIISAKKAGKTVGISATQSEGLTNVTVSIVNEAINGGGSVDLQN